MLAPVSAAQRRVLEIIARAQLETANLVPGRLVRSALRQFPPEQVNVLLGRGVPRLITQSGQAPHEEYGLTLDGLLNTSLGADASKLLEDVLRFFQHLERARPAFRSYGWEQLKSFLRLGEDRFFFTISVLRIANLDSGGSFSAGPPAWFTLHVPSDIEQILRCEALPDLLALRLPSPGSQGMPPSSTTEPTASPSTTLNEILSIQDNASEFARLKAQVHSGRVIPFVGAGLSIPCGFPGWTAFLLEEAKHAGIEAEIQADLSAGKYGEAAQRLEDELHSFAFRRRIATVFGKELLPSGAVKLLPEIAAGSIITTNFDRVIERVFKDASKPLDSVWGARFGAIRNALFTQARYLLKLHGDAYDETERVLTQAEYDQHYGDIQDPLRPLPYALKAIFSSATLLFLGCSLTVDRTIKILGQLSSQPVAPEHYAIVEAPDSQEDFRLRRRALSGLRIVPIWYPRARHHSVEVLLRALCSPTP